MKKKRVVLKLSGRTFSSLGISSMTESAIESTVGKLKSIKEIAELAVVIGSGNYHRGRGDSSMVSNLEGVTSDHIGMLFTVINALVLADYLKRFGDRGDRVVVLSRFPTPAAVETYCVHRAREILDSGAVLLLAGGSGFSGFSTDTAAMIFARELAADIVFKGTTVAGVYNVDPEGNPTAYLIEKLSCRDFLNRNLGFILDRSAVILAEQYNLPIRVFDFRSPQIVSSVFKGDNVGTLIHP